MIEDNKDQNKSIQDNVLAAIEAGRVQMRPRWQFVLQGALMAVGLVLSALALLFTGSFIIFVLQQNGTWFAPAFGGPGVRELFMAMPLIFIAVALIFVILLQILVRRYAFSYTQPVLYSVMGVAAFVVLGSLLVAQSHVHEGLFKQAREERLPVVGGFYKQFGNPHAERVIPGLIVELFDKGFVMIDPHAETITVIVAPNTQFPNGRDINVGDNVIVLGNKNGGNILAEGIRTIEGREDMFEHHLKMTPKEIREDLK